MTINSTSSTFYFGTLASFRYTDYVEHPVHIHIIRFYEYLFVIDVLSNFLIEYYDPLEGETVRDIAKISYRYLTNGFIMDIIPSIPF